jgi:hypothetical protein
MARILIGGILGGIAIFLASFITHMLTPLGAAGLNSVPADDAVQRSLKANMPAADGLYFFPAGDPNKMSDPILQAEWTAKNKQGGGLIIYHPNGSPEFGPKPLLLELASNILIALLAAFIVSLTSASFAQRIILVTLLGVISWGSISLSYWNWYGYPRNFILAEGVDQAFGWLLCGIVLAVVFRKHRQLAMA